MLRLFPSQYWLIFFLTGMQVLVPCIARPESNGLINYSIEWGSLRRTYTYIFSGTVRCGSQLCADARVQAQVDPGLSAGASGETLSGADGHFEVRITCDASADDSVVWKMVAAAPILGGGDPVELEGRFIMAEDQTTIVVQRPVQINRG
jgi:hypothetical protein